MRRYRTFRAFLSSRPGDQLRVALSALLLVSVSIGFIIGSFSRIRHSLLRLCGPASLFVPGNPAAERVVSAVDAADRQVPGDRTCLMRSLTAEALLRLYGFTPEHRIGVTKATDTEMKAHSWLELRDDVLIGDLENLSRYEPLPSLEMVDRV
ncbi:lasso peptide biosynthesis B2 protein [Halorubrum ejinorense]|uniref:Lasso peptide biosynthesis B2 protein n=1 Tax=Halorubrum ejinorense TaxID=425309 RepID=A0AAV3SRD3_9EURY